ncbi:substrate import-associated zinc metallohydrolase lipoprotein [Chryseolinea serpens]|uniref:Substrate import-associated zinc metallohydrolase lipoprotein n=1 Tax=Chryseolinea serpens TaxID=947013 RepID=A0A1M5RCK5_9BACT|nr:putative zinc-binding metallopeptidase [Chryseolinea serpens]SHH23860.1 substrate import-associated zinc metallohydrolase lipoprotein [Chryseolinea serpens]
MKTQKRTLLTILILVVLTLGCQDVYNDKVDPSKTDYVTNDNNHTDSELDKWLLSNFTYPYNIEVKYHWDASEGDLFRTLVPPKVSQVQPVMEVVKKVWIDPYSDLAGAAFIKKYCPKQFLMIGSARYNPDGTFTLGTAEGGRKVMLYVVNSFEPTQRSAVKQLMHIVQHEFGHILNQTVSYPSSFREVTPGAYTSDWRFNSVAQARAAGFITNYAMASPDEDFVEMIATMLIEGKEGYEAILACETNSASLALLRKKEALVAQYYRESFNIDFYALQTKVQEAINNIAPPGPGPEELPPLADEWGFDKENTTLRFDLTLMNEPSEFSRRFAQDNRIIHDAGFALDYNFKLYYTSENELALKLYYYDLSDDAKVYQQAVFYYFLTPHEDGTIDLLFSYADDNATHLNNDLGVGALNAFFANRKFRFNWVQTCSGDVFVGLYPQDSPENFSFGVLEK